MNQNVDDRMIYHRASGGSDPNETILGDDQEYVNFSFGKLNPFKAVKKAASFVAKKAKGVGTDVKNIKKAGAQASKFVAKKATTAVPVKAITQAAKFAQSKAKGVGTDLGNIKKAATQATKFVAKKAVNVVPVKAITQAAKFAQKKAKGVGTDLGNIKKAAVQANKFALSKAKQAATAAAKGIKQAANWVADKATMAALAPLRVSFIKLLKGNYNGMAKTLAILRNKYEVNGVPVSGSKWAKALNLWKTLKGGEGEFRNAVISGSKMAIKPVSSVKFIGADGVEYHRIIDPKLSMDAKEIILGVVTGGVYTIFSMIHDAIKKKPGDGDPDPGAPVDSLPWTNDGAGNIIVSTQHELVPGDTVYVAVSSAPDTVSVGNKAVIDVTKDSFIIPSDGGTTAEGNITLGEAAADNEAIQASNQTMIEEGENYITPDQDGGEYAGEDTSGGYSEEDMPQMQDEGYSEEEYAPEDEGEYYEEGYAPEDEGYYEEEYAPEDQGEYSEDEYAPEDEGYYEEGFDGLKNPKTKKALIIGGSIALLAVAGLAVYFLRKKK
jgi:hypothetical protein